MQRALELLQDGTLPVRDVASSVGYRQPAQFAKTFRRHHGAPPSSFRARHAAATARRLSGGPPTERAATHCARPAVAGHRLAAPMEEPPGATRRQAPADREMFADRHWSLRRSASAIALAIDWFPTHATSSAAEESTRSRTSCSIVSVPIFVLVMTVAIYSRHPLPRPPGRQVRRRADPRQHASSRSSGSRSRSSSSRVARRLRLDRARRRRGQEAGRDGRRRHRPAVRLALRVPAARRRAGQATSSWLPKDRAGRLPRSTPTT